MTEAEWLACNDPRGMLEFLWDKTSDRKLRLFAVACCQCSRQILLNKDFRQALEISTRFADGQATEDELLEAFERSNTFACGLYNCSNSQREIHRWAEATAVADATAVVTAVEQMAGYAVDAAWMIHRAAHRNPNKRLAEVLRDICGNPFRPANIPSGVLAWNDGTVPKIAQVIYDERRFGDMPILADALEDAGCDNEDILRHCRESSEHARGCWCIDLILGRK